MRRPAGPATAGALFVALGLAANACTDPATGLPGNSPNTLAATSAPWSGTSVSVDGTTTVTTLDGAIWAQPAALEPLWSIGVSEGAPEEMFGSVDAIVATSDRVYVADASVPVVRVFDRDGGYHGTIGRRGEGPGEYLRPVGLGFGATGLVVWDVGRRRILRFSEDGSLLAGATVSTGVLSSMLWVAPDGAAYVMGRVDPSNPDPELRHGLIGFDSAGAETDRRLPPRIDYDPERLPSQGPPCVTIPLPYGAEYRWTTLSDGSLAAASTRGEEVVVERTGGRYRVRAPFEAVALSRPHREYVREYMTVWMRWACGTPDWTWGGTDVPDSNATVAFLMAGPEGSAWVARPVASRRLDDDECDSSPGAGSGRPGRLCWQDEYRIEAYDREGQRLGEVVFPAKIRLPPAAFIGQSPVMAIQGDRVYFAAETELGVIQLRAYRLVTTPRSSED